MLWFTYKFVQIYRLLNRHYGDGRTQSKHRQFYKDLSTAEYNDEDQNVQYFGAGFHLNKEVFPTSLFR